MRILVAHNIPKARTGGASRTMAFIHDEIAVAGHTVDYFCAEDIPIIFRGRHSRLIFPWLVRQRALQAARTGRPYDIINVHEPSSAVITRFKCAAGNPAVIVMSYGVEQRGWELLKDEWRLGRDSLPLKTRVLYPLTSLWQSRLGLQRADHILCKNMQDRAYLMNWLQLPGDKITRISPGAGLLYAEAAQKRNYAKAERLLFAGSWITRKGTRDIVPAFLQLAARYPHLRLIVLGGGKAPDNILADFPSEYHSRVECVQTNSEEETAAAFAAADLYLLPSLFEGTPLTLMEAMMSGLPIVTTATSGMQDTIEDGRNGLLIPVRAPERMVEAVSQLLDNEALRERLGKAAQAEALSRYTWDRVAIPVSEVYENLLTSKERNTNQRDSFRTQIEKSAEKTNR